MDQLDWLPRRAPPAIWLRWSGDLGHAGFDARLSRRLSPRPGAGRPGTHRRSAICCITRTPRKPTSAICATAPSTWRSAASAGQPQQLGRVADSGRGAPTEDWIRPGLALRRQPLRRPTAEPACGRSPCIRRSPRCAPGSGRHRRLRRRIHRARAHAHRHRGRRLCRRLSANRAHGHAGTRRDMPVSACWAASAWTLSPSTCPPFRARATRPRC